MGEIKPVAWRAKTPRGWVVGKVQHCSSDEGLYPQSAIDALRAEVESERKHRLRAEGLASAWLSRHDFLLESFNEGLAERAELEKALRGALVLHGLPNDKIELAIDAVKQAAEPRYTITAAGRAQLAGEGR